MPLQLQVRSDNGNSEAKNQTVFKYCSWLVCRSAFVNITLGQLRPGHAHFRADQKFRVASGEISKCRDTLEEKAGFIDALKNMPNTVVESLDGTYDWKEFFSEWDVSYHGHTQNIHQSRQGQRAVHVFKFVQRQHVSIDMMVTSRFSVPADPRDCVLLTKPFLASRELSQPPVVCLPYAYLSKLDPNGPTNMAPRSKFSELQAKEFQKTATKLSQAPYHLVRCGKYLNAMVQNELPENTPTIDWVRKPFRKFTMDLADIPALSLDFKVTVPAPVVVANEPAPKAKRATASTPLLAAGPQLHGNPDAGTLQQLVSVLRKPAAAAPKARKRPAAAAPAAPGVPAAPAAPGVSAAPAASLPQPRAWKKLRLGPLPDNYKEILGCGKCTYRTTGCSQCRLKAGLVETEDGSWIRRSSTPVL